MESIVNETPIAFLRHYDHNHEATRYPVKSEVVETVDGETQEMAVIALNASKSIF